MDSVLIAVASFFPMLVLLVVVHELGHFWTARFFGVKTLEFGVGYPPRAFGVYTGRTETLLTAMTVCLNGSLGAIQPGQVVRVLSGETDDGRLTARYVELRGVDSDTQRSLDDVASDEYLQHEGKVREVHSDRIVLADMIYSLNWLPLGGFVRLSGENNPAAPQSLARCSVGKRAIVLVAGSAMNALFPIVAFAIMAMVPHTEWVGGAVQITEVAPDSPAAAAGLLPGDLVLAVGDKPLESSHMLWQEARLAAGTEMTWVIERDGQQRIMQIVPRENPPQGQGAVGVRIDMVGQEAERRSEPPWVALRLGVTETWDMLKRIGQEVRGWFGGGRGPELSGPIGIAQIAGEVTRAGGFQGWMVVAILLSINLAVLNILPIPMLDGGRLLFVAIEWARGGKRVPSNKEGLVHLIGFIMIIALVIALSAQDIIRLAQGVSPLGG